MTRWRPGSREDQASVNGCFYHVFWSFCGVKSDLVRVGADHENQHLLLMSHKLSWAQSTLKWIFFFSSLHIYKLLRFDLNVWLGGLRGAGWMKPIINNQKDAYVCVCVCGNSWENTVLTHSRLLLGADTVLYNVKAVLWCDCRSAAALRCPGTNKNKSFRWRSISID